MSPRQRLPLRALLVLSLLAWIAAACGGDGGAATDGGSSVPDGGADAAGGGDLGGTDGAVGDDGAALPPDTAAGGDDTGAAEDVVEVPGPAVRFDLEGADFFDSPFPSLLRTAADGALDWTDIPNPGNVPLVTNYVTAVMTLARGAGCSGAVYFGLSAPLDPAGLPAARDTLAADAPVQLVDIDPASPEYGTRQPVRVRQVTDASDGFFTPPVLTVQPVFGIPLRGATLYAVVLTRDLRAADGGRLQSAAPVAAALAGSGPADVQEAFAPLAAALPDLGLEAADIAAATVFRTFDPTAELRALRDWAWAEAAVPEVLTLEQKEDEDGYTVYEGRFSSLNFQQGTPPYDRDGGFAWERDTPLSTREDLTFSLVVPDEPFETAPGRVPVVISSHGTFGDHRSCIDDGSAIHIADVGLPTLCINQPLHGDRWTGSGANPQTLELYSFNFTNPTAGVTTFRQAAMDNVMVARLLRDGGLFHLPGDAPRLLQVDPDELYFFGHSQGGIVGALFFGVEPNVRGGVLSGAGGVLTETILHRTDPTDIRQLVALVARIENADTLTPDHPLLVLIQNASDLTDPVNYARLVNRDGNRKHIMMTEGTVDPNTPPEAAEPLATALRLPLLDPIAQLPAGHEVLGLVDPIDTPFSGTLDAGGGALATAFLVQFENAGHFPIFYDSRARDLYKKLYRAMTTQDVPVIE